MEWVNGWLWLKNVQLWLFEMFWFYCVYVCVCDGDCLFDEYVICFGVCIVMVDVECGFLLNGKFVELCGVNFYYDNGLFGLWVFFDVECWCVCLMKVNGYNVICIVYNLLFIVFFDVCDEEGLFVIDEFVDSWQFLKKINGYQWYFDMYVECDFVMMIVWDFNYLLIVMWSIGNEIFECFNLLGVVVGCRFVDIV